MKHYKETLHDLQVELVKLQRHVIASGEKLLILFEGRDAAGKDGTIKRIVEHLSPRETRVVALGRPNERDRTSWYFQRYAPYLPAAEEIVCFNRSWYNRAGVERVMGFCKPEDVDEFFETVNEFEQMLVRSGIRLFKYYLDIDRDEQKKRLDERRHDPLKQWKISPIDEAAVKHWKDYSKARDEMLARTHSLICPWTIVRANDKKKARINVIRDILNRSDYPDRKEELVMDVDPAVVFNYSEAARDAGLIAP